MKFAHIADIHISYKQYNSMARLHDFGQAFLWVCEDIVYRECDFVILAGDLFHSPVVDDYVSLNYAVNGLSILKDADIPVYAVEGNHDKPRSNKVGPMQLMELLDLLVLLDNNAIERDDAFIWGFGWRGASSEQYVKCCPKPPKKTSIFIGHFSVEGMMDHSFADTVPLSSLPVYDYVALGHIHKKWNKGSFYNPGSTETNSTSELKWQRGYYVWEDGVVEHIENPKRDFITIDLRDMIPELNCKDKVVVVSLLDGHNLKKSDIRESYKDALFVRINDISSPVKKVVIETKAYFLEEDIVKQLAGPHYKKIMDILNAY